MPAMLARLRIGPKLLLAPMMVLVLLIVSSSGAYYAYLRQNQSFNVIVEHRAARIRDAADLVAEVQQVHARVYQLLTWLSASFSVPRIEALTRDIHARHAAIEVRFAALSDQLPVAGTERELLAQSRAAHALYLKAVLDVLELSQADHSMSANAMSKAESAFGTMAHRLAELSSLERALSEQASRGAAADFRTVSILLPLLIAVSVLLSLGITMAVRRALLREVHGIGQAALDLASGNLTVRERVYGSDEIAETSRVLDTSIRNLNTTLKDIAASAQSIDDTSREIVELDQMTQQNSELVHEAAQAAQRLQRQALHLSQAVASFKLDEVGEEAQSGERRGKGKLHLASRRE